MTATITAYKWLTSERQGSYGHGDYSAHLPRPSRPGKWTERVKPQPCVTGWHVTDVSHLWNHWKLGGTLYVAECRGASSAASDKTAWESIRLVRPVGVLTGEIAVAFACDVAERVLPIFEQRFPNDDRPRKAIEAARRGDDAYDAYAAYAAAYAADAYAAAYADAAACAADAAAYAAACAADAYDAYAYAAYAAYADAAACAADAANTAAYAAADASAYAYAGDRAALRLWAGERLLTLLAAS